MTFGHIVHDHVSRDMREGIGFCDAMGGLADHDAQLDFPVRFC